MSLALVTYAAWLWIAYFPSFHHPVVLLDSMVDVAFLAQPRPALAFVFEHHNEHVIALTRAASLLDLEYFHLRYGVHQAIALIALAATVSSFVALLSVHVPSWTARIGGGAVISTILLAPWLMSVAAFPYFLMHLLITPLQIGCTFFAYRLISDVEKRRLANTVALACFALLCLVTGGNGIAVALLAIAMPALMLRAIPASRWLPHAVIAGMLVLLWAIAVRPQGTDGLVSGLLAHPVQATAYFLRILGAPAYFLWPVPTVGLLAGILVVVIALGAVAIATMRCERFPTLAILCTALILGHMASAALAAIARSPLAGASPETPKYACYALVTLAASLTVYLAASRRNDATRLAILSVGAAMALAITQSTSVFVAEREYFRTVQVLEYALAQSIEVPETKSLLAAGLPQVLDNLVPLLETARSRDLNFFGVPPFRLIGHASPDSLSGDCQGSIDTRNPVETRTGNPAVELAGWAFSSGMGQNRSILVQSADNVVGVGEFTTVRPDIVQALNLHAPPLAPLQWRAYAPVAASTPIRVGLYDRDSGQVCWLPARGVDR